MKTFLDNTSWCFVDHSKVMIPNSPLESFGMDDTFCHLVGRENFGAVVRSWVHSSSVVLGIQDHRLPNIAAGQQFLTEVGFVPIVRNSGGLAVVLDEGVLNISLVFKDPGKLAIDTAFTYMVDFVKLLLPEVAERIEAYEIVGSYCPGTFDLSIGGQKFAGISQRRMQNGIAVQIYLCVEGSGAARAELIREFYDIGIQGGPVKYDYPKVNPAVMASLQELLGDAELTVEKLNAKIPEILSAVSVVSEFEGFTAEQLELNKQYLERIYKRNKSLLAK